MMIAESCKKSATGGFQGCKNYPTTCSFDGFYLAQYSPEGLCNNCELKEFPDRFHGCICCGYAIDYHSHFCFDCKRGIDEWLRLLFRSSPKNKEFFNEINIGVHCIVGYGSEKTAYHSKRKLNLPPLGISHKWPGFHTGSETFITPAISQLSSQVNINDITWGNKETVLMRELEKINIRLYDQIQYRE